MYLAIIILPLLGSIVSGFFGRKVGVSGAQLITSTSVILTTIIAILAFIEVALNNIYVSVWLFRWIDSESLNVLWGFNFDSLTVSMLIPVLIISSLVHIYSIGYMSHDPHNQRFFSYLSLFTFMMIILVTANNFLLMFVGWEGVGICSYLLVSFWFTRIAANQSSMSAFLTNRVGDCFLTLGMFTIIWTFGNLDYSTVFSLAPYINENAVIIIGICLLIGAMAKSSQIGLHVWLPLAMEGPTPVSALIHAATMVTAGVYLLMRSSPLIEYSSTVLIICLWIGSVTTVSSSLIGLFQQDIKKVIAYSTMSQLGMMVIAVGLSSYNLALFHLINHAFYKGLLFLGAGAVIHAVADNQDFRKYGGLLAFLPLTYTVMLIASLSLIAFPFMTGFYSKDFILESALGQFKYSSISVYFVAVIGAMFTTLYSVKVLYLTFIANPNGPLISYKNTHEGDIFMSLPLVVLAIFSIFFGYITKDIFIGLATGLFADNSLFIHPTHEIVLNTEFGVSTLFKLLPFIITLLSVTLSIYIFEILPNFVIYFKSTRIGYNIFSFFSLRLLVEFIYNRFITRFIFNLGGQTTKVLDKGSVELIGPFGLEKGLGKLSENLSKLDTGVITSYALYILIGLIIYTLIPYIFYNDISLLMLVIYALYLTSKPNYESLKKSVDNKSDTSANIISQSSLFRLPNVSTKRYMSTNKGKQIAHTVEEEQSEEFDKENEIFEQDEDDQDVSGRLYDALSRVGEAEFPLDASEEEINFIATQREIDAIEVLELKDKLPQPTVDRIMEALPAETRDRYLEFIGEASGETVPIDHLGRILDKDGQPERFDPKKDEKTPDLEKDLEWENISTLDDKNNDNDDGDNDNGSGSGITTNEGTSSNVTGDLGGSGLEGSSNDSSNHAKDIMSDLEPLVLLLKNLTENLVITIVDTFTHLGPVMAVIVPIIKISTHSESRLFLSNKLFIAIRKIHLLSHVKYLRSFNYIYILFSAFIITALLVSWYYS